MALSTTTNLLLLRGSIVVADPKRSLVCNTGSQLRSKLPSVDGAPAARCPTSALPSYRTQTPYLMASLALDLWPAYRMSQVADVTVRPKGWLDKRLDEAVLLMETAK